MLRSLERWNMKVECVRSLDPSVNEDGFKMLSLYTPLMSRIRIKRIRIDPKKVKRFSVKTGEEEHETYGTPRHKYDWTRSEGRNSGWANVEELAESIRRDGIIHKPLVCSFRKFGYNDDLMVVHGWRRIRAAILNKEDIEVDYTEDLSPEEAEILCFKENYDREPLTDSEIAEFLYRVKKRHPDWTYEKIGEVYGLGGKNPESKRKVVGTYLSHFDFLEKHREDVKRFDISLSKLTRKLTMQIRATAREIVGEERKEELETEILRVASQEKVPIGPLCRVLREKHRAGEPISVLEASQLLKQKDSLLEKGGKRSRWYLRLLVTPRIAEALKRCESDGESGIRESLEKILMETLERFLEQRGYLPS